jgi:predicted aspartyl protease
MQFKDGLLYATIALYINGKVLEIKDVIIDTGAFHTILLTDYLEDLDADFSEDDELIKASGYGGIQFSSVRKKIDKIKLGDIELSNIKIDFGVIDPLERVNGLIGLDFLKGAATIIDLVDLAIIKK